MSDEPRRESALPQRDPEQDVEDLEPTDEQGEKVKGGSKILQASNDMKKGIIANFRV
jgi:hypothetical protein